LDEIKNERRDSELSALYAISHAVDMLAYSIDGTTDVLKKMNRSDTERITRLEQEVTDAIAVIDRLMAERRVPKNSPQKMPWDA
jgi:hypothetical protein